MKSLGIWAGLIFILSAFFGCGEVNIIETQTQEERLTIDLEIIEDYRQKEGITFVEDSAAYPIQYLILEEGTGSEISFEDIVFVDYTLKETDNVIFHTSVESVAEENDIYDENLRYRPAVFTHTQTGWGVTPILGQPSGSSTNSNYELGWKIGVTSALQRMKVGGRALIISPSSYAYQSFNPFGIPDFSVVIYEVSVLNAK